MSPRKGSACGGTRGLVATTTKSKRATRRRKYIGWHNDNASNRSGTSETILLNWLTTPGNYARWQTSHKGQDAERGSGESRADLCSEVNALLRSQGIGHRKNTDIYNKIVGIEKSFLAAKRWLQETGLMRPFLQGTAGKDVDGNVAQLCRHYRAVAPAFAATQNASASEDAVDVTQGSSDEEDNEAENRREQRDGGQSVGGWKENAAVRSGHELEGEGANTEAGGRGERAQTQAESATRGAGGPVVDSNQSNEAGELGVEDKSTIPPLLSREDNDDESKAEGEDEEQDDAGKETWSGLRPASVAPWKKKLHPRHSSVREDALMDPPTQSPAATVPVASALVPHPMESPARAKVVKYAEAKRSIAPKRKTSDVSSLSSSPDVVTRATKATRKARGHKPGRAAVATASKHPEELQAILRACEEERERRQTLFELECDKLLQELEEKKIRVVAETALARKKLLDAGVPQTEVDRILPL